MAEDPPDYRRSAAVSRAVGIHGTDTEGEFSSSTLIVLLQCAIALTPLAFLAGAAAGAAFFSSACVFWACVALVALLARPSLVGLAGALQLLAGLRFVVLVYKDRLVVQKGMSYQDVTWDEVEAVYVRTNAGSSENIFYYEPGSPSRLWIGTEVPLAKFWAEWTEIRTRDGRAIRLPSTISDYEGMSRAVQTEVSARAHPPAVAALRAGRPASFGPLTITREILTIGNYEATWAEHHCTWSQGGHVVSTTPSGSQLGLTVSTEQVPNLAVACEIIYQMSSGQFFPTEEG